MLLEPWYTTVPDNTESPDQGELHTTCQKVVLPMGHFRWGELEVRSDTSQSGQARGEEAPEGVVGGECGSKLPYNLTQETIQGLTGGPIS